MSKALTKFGYAASSIIVFYVIFFMITPWVFKDLTQYRKKHSTKTFSDKLSVALVNGICEFGNSNTLNTSNKYKSNYIDLPPATNRAGGIEFSYTFWAKLGELQKDNLIFIKGTNPSDGGLTKKFSQVYDDKGNMTSEDKHLLKAPMVKISKHNLTVSFNTARKINNEVKFELDKEKFLQSTDMNPRWFMFSICFKEGDFTTDFGMKTKGIIVDIFLNEQHVKTHFVEKDSLRLNDGDIYFFPGTESSNERGNQLGNLYYHNYALNTSDVQRIWSSGLDTTGCAAAAQVEEVERVKTIQVSELGQTGAQFVI